MPSKNTSEVPPKPQDNVQVNRYLWILFPLVVVLVLGWLYFPSLKLAIQGTPTSTPLPPTYTPPPTLTFTITPAPTLTPTITNTPVPSSAYQVVDPNVVHPTIPAPFISAYVLNDDNALTVDPGFDYPTWYTSDVIAAQIGVLISEPFHATKGPGSAIWKMDNPLDAGVYNIFVMDTLFSSGGTLDFTVQLGGTVLSPVMGQTQLEYLTLSGTPEQTDNAWRCIGTYYIDSPDILSISTSWDARDDNTLVAVDRILITRLPDSTRNFISALPVNAYKAIIDDTSAKIESYDTWYTRSDQPAWGDQFQMVVNPENNSTVTWTTPDLMPAGTYQVSIWVPEVSGTSEVLYKLFANGQEQPGAIVIDQGALPSNQWILLGTWDLNAGWVQPSMVMAITPGTVGEIAIDAILFVRLP